MLISVINMIMKKFWCPKVTIEDLRDFGMIPEFIGRLPIIFTLQGLTKDMLVKILKEPKNAILKQYQKLLALDEVDLRFDDSAILMPLRKRQSAKRPVPKHGDRL